MSFRMKPKVVWRGTTLRIPVAFKNPDGSILDMTPAQLSGILHITKPSSSVADLTLTTTDANFVWDDQANGLGFWQFLENETDQSPYDETSILIEQFVKDTSVSPDDIFRTGWTRYPCRDLLSGTKP